MRQGTDKDGPAQRRWVSWNALSIAVSVAVCGGLIGLHLRQKTEIAERTALLDRVRDAQQDLASGFLHVNLSGVAGPFDRGQGLALIDQAVASLDEAMEGAAEYGLMTDSELRDLPVRAARFHASLGGPAHPDTVTRQRLAFHSLQESIETFERQGEEMLRETEKRLDREFAIAVVAAALLLGGVSGGAYRVSRLRQKALRENQASERRLRLFVENAPVALAMFDREMRYIVASRRWREDYHLGEQVLAGRSHYEVFPEIGEAWKQVHQRALRGETVECDADSFRRQNGSVQWLHWEVRPWLDAAGEIGGIVILTEDISVRRTAENAQLQLAAIVEASNDAIYGKTLQGVITTWNRGAERLFGYTQQEVLGRPALMLFPPERREEEQDILMRVTRGEAVESQETVRVHKDGRRLDVSVTISPIRDAAGVITGVSSIARDISERRRARQAEVESQARVRAILENLSEGIVVADLAGRLLQWNPAARRMLGFEPEEDLSSDLARVRSLFELRSLDGRPLAAEEWPMARILAGEKLHGLEVRVKRQGESERIFSYSGSVVHPPTGEPLAYVAMADVTREREATEALRESEEQFRTLVALSPDAVFINQGGRVVYMNRRGLELWRVKSEDEIIGTDPVELIHPDCRSLVRERIERLWAHGGAAPVIEIRILTRDGTAVDVETVAAVFDYRGLPAIQVVVRDITERKRAEAALRMSEEKFSRAFANNPAAIALTRLDDGRVLDVNDTWVELCGYRREEVIGRSARMMWPTPEEAERFVRELKTKGFVQGWEQGFRKKSGERFVAQLSTVLLALEGEEVILSTLVDITARIRAEEAWRTHEAVLRETGRIAKVGGWSFEVATGQGYWTEEVARIHDLDPATVTSRDQGLSYYHGEHRRRIEAAIRAAVEEGAPYDLELEMITATGRRKWVRTIGHPEKENGQVVRVRGSFQDVTERRRIDRRLATQAAVSRVLAEAATLAEATPQLVEAIATSEGWQFGAAWEAEDGQRLRCIRMWQAPELVGDPAAEALAEVTQKKDFALGEGIPGRVWSTGEVALIPDLRQDRGYVRADRAIAAGLNSALAFPVVAGGEVIGVIDFLAREIRETDEGMLGLFELLGRQIGLFVQRRRAEAEVRRLNAELEERVRQRTAQLEAANRELEAFSYSVSHDLRAPLRAVDGFALALVEDYGASLPEEGRGYLKRVRDGAQRMGRLIDDLLAFSRLGRKSLAVQQVDMAALVAEVLESLRAERAGQEEIAIGPLPACRGDVALLRQVWLNLIGNALKYSRGAKPARIEIGQEPAAEGTGYFVKDNGAGFDMRYAHKLFGVFQRLHRAEEFEGTGVGLAIVQRIVQRHGGRVWAEGEVGRGAIFHFTVNATSTPPS